MSIAIIVLVLPGVIVMAPFVPVFLVGGALVWLLNERTPELKERSVKALLAFNRGLYGAAIIIPMLVFIMPAISLFVYFRLQVWNVVFYAIFPAWVLWWNLDSK
jgi:hypothetical protein